MPEAVLDVLNALRSPFVAYETDIHALVDGCLRGAGLSCVHEAKIGVGCRIDFLCGGVGIEIKKGRPTPAKLLSQLKRYAACDAVQALIVITQRSVSLPDTVGGKPLHVVSLNRLWGVALP